MLTEDVAEYLEDQSFGTVGTDIFIGDYTDTPDDQISVVSYTGTGPEVVTRIEYPGLQINVRSADFSTGEETMNEIYAAFHQLTHTTLNSTFYPRFDATGSPIYLGRDAVRRHMFTCSFAVTKFITED